MWSYVARRLLYTPLIVFGVLLITFVLFRAVPGDPARMIAGKNATAETIAEIRKEYGYDKPLFFNTTGESSVFDSQFFGHFFQTICFDFGRSWTSKQKITTLLADGAGPSLKLTVPMFLGLLVTSVAMSLLVAYRQGTAIDTGMVVLCVTGMSIPSLAFILFGQAWFAGDLGWFPVQGYEPGWSGAQYFVLPALIGIAYGLGGEVRFYRTVMLDEIRSDYIRTAFAKGVGPVRVLFVHLLKNAMIPILTMTVMSIPFLFLGSLLLERFFGIPGLGYMMLEAISSRDMPVINALTYLISLLFVLGQLLTDIGYALVDPRISLE